MMYEYYLNELNMDYNTLSLYLQDKYGIPNGNYFINESCNIHNKCIKRINEGLYIHHIAEYHNDYSIIDNLSLKEKALQFPYEFQTSKWLCYCNYIEHTILHYLIYRLRIKSLNVSYLDDGLVHLMFPELKEWYKTKGRIVRGTWCEPAYNVVRDDEKFFQFLYRQFYTEFPSAPKYSYNEYLNAQKNHKLQRPKNF